MRRRGWLTRVTSETSLGAFSVWFCIASPRLRRDSK